jgi:murein DD-endopeptidase MepM/ murein hydrolase activator NlpD
VSPSSPATSDHPTRAPTDTAISAEQTAAPSVTPSPPPSTSTPAPSTSTPSAAQPTPTAIPAATATPASTSAAAGQLAERRYVFPVRSKGKLSYGKYHHDYPAADIFCPIGSDFLAVTSGVVDYVSREDTWDPKVNDGATRGGLSVAIVGDDGVRYYGSHLSAVAEGIEPGVRVEAGQLLGQTGKSGDARFTDSHLHFGISHPTTADDWQVRRGEIASYPYLKAWERGEDVTPKLP